MRSEINQQISDSLDEPDFLAIDAGASKTIIVLASSANVELVRVKGAGAHVGKLNAGIWEIILPLVIKASNNIGTAFVPERLTCCLAIAGFEHVEALASARAASPQFAHLSLVSDGFAALHGCYGANRPGIMIAVGTGTVAWARTNQGSNVKMGGHGFPVGDEGGGAWIGLALVRHTLRLAETNSLDMLGNAVLFRFDRDISILYKWLATAGPAEYASLAPLAFKPELSGKATDTILLAAARELGNLANRADPNGALSLTLTGGLADHLKPWIKRVIHRDVRWVKDAVISGVFTLGRV